MAMLGQASGGFTESSSSLRLLHVGIRNSTGVLADDAFTQSNPANATQAAYAANSPQVATSVLGVLSGSIAFTRPTALSGGNNEIGGLGYTGYSGTAGADNLSVRPLGVFINHAAGYSFENTPALASSKSPYVSAQGTYANSLFETFAPVSADVDISATYTVGISLVSSVNGFLIPSGATATDKHGGDDAEVIAILKMVSDSAQEEIMYDQRI